MNMFDEAAALRGTISMRGISQSEMAKMLGVSQSYVANKLRLLSFDEAQRQKICDAGLSERHARALLRLRSKEERERALGIIIDRGLSVAQSEALVDLFYEPLIQKSDSRAASHSKTESFKKSLAESVRLLRSFGVDVSLSQSYYGTKLYLTVTLDETAV